MSTPPRLRGGDPGSRLTAYSIIILSGSNNIGYPKGALLDSTKLPASAQYLPPISGIYGIFRSAQIRTYISCVSFTDLSTCPLARWYLMYRFHPLGYHVSLNGTCTSLILLSESLLILFTFARSRIGVLSQRKLGCPRLSGIPLHM